MSYDISVKYHQADLELRADEITHEEILEGDHAVGSAPVPTIVLVKNWSGKFVTLNPNVESKLSDKITDALMEICDAELEQDAMMAREMSDMEDK